MSTPEPRPDAGRRDARRRRRVHPGVIAGIVAAVVVIAALVGTLVVFAPTSASTAGRKPSRPVTPSATPTASSTPTPTPTPTPAPTVPVFDKTAMSIDDPNSVWVVVNKTRPLDPQDYAPPLAAIPVGGAGGALRMRPEAAQQLTALSAQYTAETGQRLSSQSDYRPYASQVRVYNGWVASKGQAQADLQSARPGYSEHQTGLAIDFVGSTGGCGLAACFADTNAGMWLASNAYKWGFILRYPRDKTPITGYEFEPWHYRYVGVPLATEMHDTGIETMEEFFGLPPAPTY